MIYLCGMYDLGTNQIFLSYLYNLYSPTQVTCLSNKVRNYVNNDVLRLFGCFERSLELGLGLGAIQCTLSV